MISYTTHTSRGGDNYHVSLLHSHIVCLCIVLCCGGGGVVLGFLAFAVCRVLCVSVCWEWIRTYNFLLWYTSALFTNFDSFVILVYISMYQVWCVPFTELHKHAYSYCFTIAHLKWAYMYVDNNLYICRHMRLQPPSRVLLRRHSAWKSETVNVLDAMRKK
jgi:hypothetical protein